MNAKELRKQEIASKIKNARIASGLTQAQVAEKLGITYQAISNYERGKNSIESDILVKMCNIYKVDPMLILSELYSCPICGYQYDSTLITDVKKHDQYHKAFCDAANYYGFCYPLNNLEKIKSKSYDILESSSGFHEKCNAAIELLKAYFSRSIAQHGYALDHPPFSEFAAMLLNQNQFRSTFGEQIYNFLVLKYGKMCGIPESETTYQIRELRNKMSPASQTTKSDSTLSDDAIKVARKYDELDDHGKHMVRLVLNEETTRVAQKQNELRLKSAKPSNGEIKEIITTSFAARGGGVRLADEEETKEAQLVYEKLLHPNFNEKKK